MFSLKLTNQTSQKIITAHHHSRHSYIFLVLQGDGRLETPTLACIYKCETKNINCMAAGQCGIERQKRVTVNSRQRLGKTRNTEL
jgi:hypothetical protein